MIKIKVRFSMRDGDFQAFDVTRFESRGETLYLEETKTKEKKAFRFSSIGFNSTVGEILEVLSISYENYADFFKWIINLRFRLQWNGLYNSIIELLNSEINKLYPTSKDLANLSKKLNARASNTVFNVGQSFFTKEDSDWRLMNYNKFVEIFYFFKYYTDPISPTIIATINSVFENYIYSLIPILLNKLEKNEISIVMFETYLLSMSDSDTNELVEKLVEEKQTSDVNGIQSALRQVFFKKMLAKKIIGIRSLINQMTILVNAKNKQVIQLYSPNDYIIIFIFKLWTTMDEFIKMERINDEFIASEKGSEFFIIQDEIFDLYKDLEGSELRNRIISLFYPYPISKEDLGREIFYINAVPKNAYTLVKAGDKVPKEYFRTIMVCLPQEKVDANPDEKVIQAKIRSLTNLFNLNGQHLDKYLFSDVAIKAIDKNVFLYLFDVERESQEKRILFDSQSNMKINEDSKPPEEPNKPDWMIDTKKDKAIKAIKDCIESGRRGIDFSDCMDKKDIDQRVAVKVSTEMVADPSYARKILGNSYKDDYADIIGLKLINAPLPETVESKPKTKPTMNELLKNLDPGYVRELKAEIKKEGYDDWYAGLEVSAKIHELTPREVLVEGEANFLEAAQNEFEE